MTEVERLRAALEEIRGVKLLTDCGIHPMRAAGIRHAFEITAEIATKALSGEPNSAPETCDGWLCRCGVFNQPTKPNTECDDCGTPRPSEKAKVHHTVKCKKFPDPFDERDPVGPCTCGAESAENGNGCQ